MMSSERFSRQSSVWRVAAPGLEQYVRWANRNLRTIGVPLHTNRDPQRNSLISEAMFCAFSRRSQRVELEDVERATAYLTRLPGARQDWHLDQVELSDADALLWRLNAMIERGSYEDPVIVRPSFPGFGIVEQAEGDILRGRVLFEVKSVERQLRSADFRQVLTYAAQDYHGENRVNRITFLNPRYGYVFSVEGEELALDVGSVSWAMMMQGIGQFMSGLTLSD